MKVVMCNVHVSYIFISTHNFVPSQVKKELLSVTLSELNRSYNVFAATAVVATSRMQQNTSPEMFYLRGSVLK